MVGTRMDVTRVGNHPRLLSVKVIVDVLRWKRSEKHSRTEFLLPSK